MVRKGQPAPDLEKHPVSTDLPANTTKPRIALDPDLDAWEQQPKESATQYARFAEYRDAGLKRTVRDIATKAGRSTAYMQQIAYRNWWHDRARSWDAERRRVRALRLEEEHDRMVDDHLTVARAMFGKVVQGLRALDANKLSATEIVRLMEAVAKLERQALGEPATTVAVQGGAPGSPAIRFVVPTSEEERLALLHEAAGRMAALGLDDEAVLDDMDLYEIEEGQTS